MSGLDDAERISLAHRHLRGLFMRALLASPSPRLHRGPIVWASIGELISVPGCRSWSSQNQRKRIGTNLSDHPVVPLKVSG